VVGVAAFVAACGRGPAAPGVAEPTVPAATTATPSPEVPIGPHELMVRLVRGACFGSCPVYAVSVYRDGSVVFVGKLFVKFQGRARGKVSAEALASIERVVEKYDFMSMGDRYTHGGGGDDSNSWITYRVGDRTKTVAHYDGDMDTRDAFGLFAIALRIDDVTDVGQWIGTREEVDKVWEQQLEAISPRRQPPFRVPAQP